jgi:hypothetical protein
MSAFRQNGSLYSISIAHAIGSGGDTSAEWASSHAEFEHLTTAFCSCNKNRPLSGLVSLDNEDTSTSESKLLVRAAQRIPRMGPNALFAGLLAPKCVAIGPDHIQQKQAIGNKKLLHWNPVN